MQFRTKARAVDLLGKGQIADLPTAITELWKNGYDAYADNLKADLFKDGYNNLEHSYFIISDDGKGMSNSDILDKWLVLGTDSKSRADSDIESEDTLWKLPRVKAGEKGIGRLSIAYLGSPMLMLSKKMGNPLQAVYFDWRLLENYNLFLDDVSIPFKSLNNINELGTIFSGLKDDFLFNFKKRKSKDQDEVWENTQIELRDSIISDTQRAILENPIIEHITDFFESDDSHGTMFLTFNPIDQILELSETDEDDLEDRNSLISSLTGFVNPFKKTKIKVNSIFNIHKKNETYNLLTSRGDFFSQADFKLADIYIKGEFEGNGSFKGKIRIYDETIDYEYTNPRKKDNRNFYGIVPIELGYSQGEEKSSNLSEIQFAQLKEKVKEYGGLYVFRDNFRVLPYGRHNWDFLNFEQRRSKRAGTYYFSYRRMYGYIDITREENPGLRDKSSREGLINNAKYRAFTNDAINFFVILAQDYFATDPKKLLFKDKKGELNAQHKALKDDKAREKKDKIAFTKSLNNYPKRLEAHQLKYEVLLDQLDEKLNQINVGYSEVEVILDELQELDIEYKSLIPQIPKHYKPTETQEERLYKYEGKLNAYLEKISERREDLNKKAQDKLEIRDLQIDFSKRYNGYISNLEKLLNENKIKLKDKLNDLTNEYNSRAEKLILDLSEGKKQLIESITTKDQVQKITQLTEKKYNRLVDETTGKLFPLVEHIGRLTFDIDEEQVQGAYKAQYEQMKHQWEQTRDTAQLGIAVEIIDHEFNQLYAKINNQLNSLDGNKIISSIKEFQFLEKNFKQLEDKYALLSPLYRMSGALLKEISGISIYEYLIEFFENQIKEYNIQIDVSKSFKNHVINIKEPVAHTVFINIINNAIYWMRNKNERIIKLDYSSNYDTIIIANSGEEILKPNLERIFDLFYSRRPNGRGIGLYLSKQSLNEAGLDITATNDEKYNTLKGACFIITKLNKDV